MFPVTDLPCKPPTTSIIDGTLDHFSAPTLKRGYENIISSMSSIDCELTYSTK